MLNCRAPGHGFRAGHAAANTKPTPGDRGSAARCGAIGLEDHASHTIRLKPCADAHAIYTDVWASMGAENEAAERRTAFADYQVDEELFTHAAPNAIFMHCLPAKRGEEVTDSVIESARSVVFDQAENRLHAQKALLLMLLSELNRIYKS